jgi:ATP adenylyltransferase/5',5'''-P-1,P-4-tetraphosphate phosphorylase II
MTSKTRKGTAHKLALKDAFEVEYARRAMERRKREEAERKQQEEDLARATQLLDALQADADFLAEHKLVVDRRRYTVSIDHEEFRIAAYFEAGKASVTLSDKRTTNPGATAPRKQLTVETLEDALAVMAQFLVDETR